METLTNDEVAGIQSDDVVHIPFVTAGGRRAVFEVGAPRDPDGGRAEACGCDEAAGSDGRRVAIGSDVRLPEEQGR